MLTTKLMMNIDFEDATASCPISAKQFMQWCETTLNSESAQNFEVSIRIVTLDEIKILNHTFRGKNDATNVLAFPADIYLPGDLEILGDIAICLPVAIDESISQQKTIEQHLAHLLIHGCLHLLGYDHEKNDQADLMEDKEIGILKKLSYPNPYLSKELNDK